MNLPIKNAITNKYPGLKNSQSKNSYLFSYLFSQKKTLSKNWKVSEMLIYKDILTF